MLWDLKYPKIGLLHLSSQAFIVFYSVLYLNFMNISFYSLSKRTGYFKPIYLLSPTGLSASLILILCALLPGMPVPSPPFAKLNLSYLIFSVFYSDNVVWWKMPIFTSTNFHCFQFFVCFKHVTLRKPFYIPEYFYQCISDTCPACFLWLLKPNRQSSAWESKVFIKFLCVFHVYVDYKL